jgi:Outer membrane protein beta-barrel domain
MKIALTVLFCSLLAVPLFADSVTVMGGYVWPRGDSEVFDQNKIETNFQTRDLNGGGIIVRYDHFLGSYVNVGGQLTVYDATTHVTDKDFEFDDGAPIIHENEFLIVPLEFNVHILPLGREARVIPYLGGGAGAYVWRYEERGDFVFDRLSNPHVVSGSAFSDGVNAGWHVEGGVYVPIAHRIALTGEVKYWQAKGHLDRAGFDPHFGPLDLSATMVSGGVSFWF